MPKAPVNENDCSILWQDYIRTARQPCAMKPEAIAQRVQESANRQFRCRVFIAYTPHRNASLFGRQVVNALAI
jgi:hypothetical protein